MLVHVVDFSGETDLEGEPTEGHDPRDDIDFLENELDMWYLDILEKGLERYRSGYHGEEKNVEEDLAEQMSAFKTNKDEIKQVLLATDAGLDPDEWDEATKERVAREIRKRTKPIVIAANKMDKPAAQEHFDDVTADPDYDHLTFVPTSAHAEKALKQAEEAGVVDYQPGASSFEIVGDPSEEQAAGLEQIREYVEAFGGTGVQDVLESALFDVMGAIAIFPGSANGSADSQGVFRDCFILPEDSTTEDFAYHLHSDIGDGLLHGIDCRSNRQVGSDHELEHRDVVEIVTTN